MGTAIGEEDGKMMGTVSVEWVCPTSKIINDRVSAFKGASIGGNVGSSKVPMLHTQ